MGFGHTCRILTPGLVCLLIGSPVVADEPFFVGVGDLPGGQAWSEALAISADGSTVVGSSESAAGLQAYKWTNPASGGTGIVGLGDLPGDPFLSIAWGVNGDGSVIVGNSYVGPTDSVAFRWTDPAAGGDGMVGLGALPGGPTMAVATCVSADGSVIGGWSAHDDSGLAQAFRWTDPDQGGDGMVGLGFLPGGRFSRGMAMTPDGSAMAGRGGSSYATIEGFRWTDPDQGGEGMIGLGVLSIEDPVSNANDLSDDALVVVGASRIPGGAEAYRWSDPTAGGAGMVSLGCVVGFQQADLRGVSADGSVAVGGVATTEMTVKRATYWTPVAGGTGLILLRPMLRDDYGLDVTGWTLTEATGIAADGRTIVGNGINPDGDNEAWIAHLGPGEEPCPGDLDGDRVIGLADLAQLLSNYDTPSGMTYEDGDLDGDEDVDLADLAALLAVYGTECD